MGKTSSVCDATPHSLVKYGMALLGRELLIVELMTVVIVVNTIMAFLFCDTV